MAKGKKKNTSTKDQSYNSLMGQPMDVANHPTNELPPPAGGAFSGLGLNAMYGGGGPNMSEYGV